MYVGNSFGRRKLLIFDVTRRRSFPDTIVSKTRRNFLFRAIWNFFLLQSQNISPLQKSTNTSKAHEGNEKRDHQNVQHEHVFRMCLGPSSTTTGQNPGIETNLPANALNFFFRRECFLKSWKGMKDCISQLTFYNFVSDKILVSFDGYDTSFNITYKVSPACQSTVPQASRSPGVEYPYAPQRRPGSTLLGRSTVASDTERKETRTREEHDIQLSCRKVLEIYTRAEVAFTSRVQQDQFLKIV